MPPSQLSLHAQRRNFVLGVANGTLLRLFDTLANPSLVLTWFVTQLGASPLVVGLLVPIANGGWFLPQLLMSGYVRGLRRKMPLYRAVSVARVVFWALLTGAVWAVGASNPSLLLVLFLLLYTVFCFGAGVTGLAWLDIIAKAVPARSRGPFFAWRDFTGGLLAIGGSVLTRYVLDERSGLRFPYNFGWLLAGGGVCAALAYLAFALISEPDEAVAQGNRPVRVGIRAVWDVPRRDHNYALFVLLRVVFLASSVCMPFYTLFAKDRLRAPVATAGTYVGAFTLALVVSTVIWGRTSERYGNRAVVLWVSALNTVAPILTLLAGARVSYAGFTLVFALTGMVQSGADIGFLSLGLDMAPAAERPLYLGLLNTVLGVVSFSLLLGGWVVSRWGLEAIFGVSAVLGVVSLLLVTRLRGIEMKD